MVDTIEAFGDVEFERILRSIPNRGEDRSDGIVAGPSWTKAIGVRRQLGFPCGFQVLADQCLPSSVRLGRNTQRAFFGRGPSLGYPDASQRGGVAIELECGGQPPSLGRGETLGPIDARGLFAPVVLGDATHGQESSIP